VVVLQLSDVQALLSSVRMSISALFYFSLYIYVKKKKREAERKKKDKEVGHILQGMVVYTQPVELLQLSVVHALLSLHAKAVC
jgi:hypothetical protein